MLYINKPFTLPVWVIILESNRWNYQNVRIRAHVPPVGFCDSRIWPPWEMKPPWGVLWLRWDEMGGWDGLVVWCLGTKDATKRCHKQHNQKMDTWKGTDEATGFNGKKPNEFRKGSIHRTTWNDSGVGNYSTGVQFGSHPASTKFGSSGHPVETWKWWLQDLRNASLEDLSSHFPSMISIWVLSHPKCCEPAIMLSVFAGKIYIQLGIWRKSIHSSLGGSSAASKDFKCSLPHWCESLFPWPNMMNSFILGGKKSFSASSKETSFRASGPAKKNFPTKNLRTKTKPRLFVGQRTWQSQSARDLRLLGGKQQSGLGFLNIYRLAKRLWDVNL